MSIVIDAGMRRMDRLEERHDEMQEALSDLAKETAGHIGECSQLRIAIMSRLGRMEAAVWGAVTTMISLLGFLTWFLLTHKVHIAI